MTTAIKQVSISVPSGRVEVPATWVGQNLAVHRPYRSDPELTALDRGKWTITHVHSGKRAAALKCSERTARKLAQAWDDRFSDLADETLAKTWEWRQTWAADVRAVSAGAPFDGPVLPDRPTAIDVGHAITGTPPLSADESTAQYPANETVPAGKLRKRDGLWQVRTYRGWFDVPTIADVEEMICDSVCETPWGDRVEPDAPESWLSLLGLI